MNTYKITFSRENGTVGIDHFTAATEAPARRDFHECYRRRGTNIIDIELTGADAPVTKELERDALEKIKCYVNKLRADKAAAQIRVRELEAEVTRLKAKLYDMTTS